MYKFQDKILGQGRAIIRSTREENVSELKKVELKVPRNAGKNKPKEINL